MVNKQAAYEIKLIAYEGPIPGPKIQFNEDMQTELVGVVKFFVRIVGREIWEALPNIRALATDPVVLSDIRRSLENVRPASLLSAPAKVISIAVDARRSELLARSRTILSGGKSAASLAQQWPRQDLEDMVRKGQDLGSLPTETILTPSARDFLREWETGGAKKPGMSGAKALTRLWRWRAK